jgi:flagellar biosynthetic protein FlhB
MAEESHLERTEPASPRRLEKAREEGQVARSVELNTFVMLLTGAGGLWLTGDHLYAQLRATVKSGLTFDAEGLASSGQMLAPLGRLTADALFACAPLLALLVIAALAAPQLLGGWLFTANALRVDFRRVDPLAGFGRLVSWQAVAELTKALAKATLVSAVAVAVLWHYKDPLLQLTALPLESAGAQAARLVVASLALIAGALALVAAADVPFQLWRHADNLKMSKEEVRRENRETEGDPVVKSAIRAQQRAIARRRMMAEVPKADVIVTNPTHYAVALRYEDGAMRAPRVIAKGADVLAAKIREVGEAHHVPVLESPPLARALYRHTELGDEIPAALYTAVAEVLAYVFQLRRHNQHGEAAPHPLREVPVPPEFAGPGPASS